MKLGLTYLLLSFIVIYLENPMLLTTSTFLRLIFHNCSILMLKGFDILKLLSTFDSSKSISMDGIGSMHADYQKLALFEGANEKLPFANNRK